MSNEVPVAVILNPAAGGGRAGYLWEEWKSGIEAEIGPCAVYRTKSPGEAKALTRAALLQGCTRIVSAGGDGTHYEVLNG